MVSNITSDIHLVLNKLLNCDISIRTLHQYSATEFSVMMELFYVCVA